MTINRRQLVTFLALGAATAWAAPVLAGPAGAREKAIFAVSDNDPQKWNLTLGNIANALDGIGQDGADIELVAYGPGIAMLKKDSPVADNSTSTGRQQNRRVEVIIQNSRVSAR